VAGTAVETVVHTAAVVEVAAVVALESHSDMRYVLCSRERPRERAGKGSNERCSFSVFLDGGQRLDVRLLTWTIPWCGEEQQLGCWGESDRCCRRQ
jgi:hypothetical protein